MARPTKRAVAIAAEVGGTPSKIQGWIDSGYGPSESGELAAHFRSLEPLMGTGRDGDVAVLKMAALGLPCRRLRQVLTGLQQLQPDEEDVGTVDELIEYGMTAPHLAGPSSFLRASATQAGIPVEYAGRPYEPDLPEVRARAALLPLAEAVLGSPLEAEDLAEFDSLMNGPTSKLVDYPVGDLDPEGSQVLLEMTLRIGDRARSVPQWLVEASMSDLVEGIQAAERLVDAVAVLGVQFNGDEERWRWVGRMAPTAARFLKPLAQAFTNIYLPLVAGAPIPAGEAKFVEAIVGSATSHEMLGNSVAEAVDIAAEGPIPK